MSDPFESPDGVYSVLVNHEGRHSLWPDFVGVPAGWTVAHGPRAWSSEWRRQAEARFGSHRSGPHLSGSDRIGFGTGTRD
ncbi:MbtH family protein [Streptomyces geranii]|uniref:MbtH family protein n=1 Tax=Streptomyces geranii TaxID=2058923 RepID=UPI000D03B0E9|nr:MbtH family protein [Streptomyces geranii]